MVRARVQAALLAEPMQIKYVTRLRSGRAASAVPQRILKGCVASISDDQARITGALDFLFQGF
jgi:hypothetical protein